jgi:hypothetical protein
MGGLQDSPYIDETLQAIAGHARRYATGSGPARPARSAPR